MLFTGIAPGFSDSIALAGGRLSLVALNDAAPVPEPGQGALLLARLAMLQAWRRPGAVAGAATVRR